MTWRSQIFIKGEREPVTVSEEQAQKINEAFTDSSVSDLTTFHTNRNTFRKDAIKLVKIIPDELPTGTRIPIWKFYSKKENMFGQREFKTYEEAKSEFDKRMELTPEDRRKEIDWVIVKQ